MSLFVRYFVKILNRNYAILNPEASRLPHTASKMTYIPEIPGLIAYS